jgi:hypothetical protein
MGDLGVRGSGDSLQIPTDAKRAQEAPKPKIAGLLPQNLAVRDRASDDSNITPKALAARTAAQPQVRANALKAGGKGTIVGDANTAGTARHEAARTIGNRTANYQQPFQEGGSITVSGGKPSAPGYIDGLLDAKTDAGPIPSFEFEGRSVALPGNKRERIATIYNEAYKATGQAQRSADEISHALQRATPQAATAQLGNIGEPLLVDVNVANSDEAKGQLTAFANGIFGSPSTQGLYTQDE